jgi:hypothetical protein
MLKDISFKEISNYLAIPSNFVWVTLQYAELLELEEMRKEFDFLFSQMFVFLPKFIKAQL